MKAAVSFKVLADLSIFICRFTGWRSTREGNAGGSDEEQPCHGARASLSDLCSANIPETGYLQRSKPNDFRSMESEELPTATSRCPSLAAAFQYRKMASFGENSLLDRQLVRKCVQGASDMMNFCDKMVVACYPARKMHASLRRISD